MDIQKLMEINKKAPKAAKATLDAYLNSIGVPFEAMKVGDKLKFPDTITPDNGTLVQGIVNGNAFYSVACTRNDNEAVNVSISSFSRQFNDRENNKVITPLDILADDKKDKAVFKLFTEQTRAEALKELQGKTVTVSALETFESVARDGSQIRVNVIGYTID